ncbi:hypothetical protein ACHQM5_026577 [Ranunculus cassubicifolius]
MASSAKFALLLLASLLASSTTTQAMKSKLTRIQFYMHDIVSGPDPTAILVAQPRNLSNPIAASLGFGNTVVIDNRLTATPDVNSTLIGRAQGIYVFTSKQDEMSALMTLTYVMVSGPYNGSTLSIVARNPVTQLGIREMPIVGGTGMFRMARGYSEALTYSTSGMDAVVGYNVTVYHY